MGLRNRLGFAVHPGIDGASYSRRLRKCLIMLLMCFVPSRFTELYVDELENEGDLRILVSDYLKGLNPNRSVISGIIRLIFPVMF